MYFLYILEMRDGRLYVGVTDSLDRRHSQHLRGDKGTRTTKIFGGGPILYHETFPDLKLALARERQIKKWSAKKKLALMNGDLKRLKGLAKPRKP